MHTHTFPHSCERWPCTSAHMCAHWEDSESVICGMQQRMVPPAEVGKSDWECLSTITSGAHSELLHNPDLTVYDKSCSVHYNVFGAFTVLGSQFQIFMPISNFCIAGCCCPIKPSRETEFKIKPGAVLRQFQNLFDWMLLSFCYMQLEKNQIYLNVH